MKSVFHKTYYIDKENNKGPKICIELWARCCDRLMTLAGEILYVCIKWRIHVADKIKRQIRKELRVIGDFPESPSSTHVQADAWKLSVRYNRFTTLHVEVEVCCFFVLTTTSMIEVKRRKLKNLRSTFSTWMNDIGLKNANGAQYWSWWRRISW